MADQATRECSWSVDAAEKAAQRLLREHLTDADWRCYTERHYLDVPGKIRPVYRIIPLAVFPGQVAVYGRNPRLSYCINPRGGMENWQPVSDVVLGMLLLIRLDEERFLETANAGSYGGRSVMPGDPDWPLDPPGLPSTVDEAHLAEILRMNAAIARRRRRRYWRIVRDRFFGLTWWMWLMLAALTVGFVVFGFWLSIASLWGTYTVATLASSYIDWRWERRG